MIDKPIILLLLTLGLLLAACGAVGEENVPSLDTGNGTGSSRVNVVEPPDNETMMMGFTECLREQGLDVIDPVLDADGNIGKPAPGDGGEFAKGELEVAYAACGEYLEKLTFEKKDVDVTAMVDEGVALAACLRERGYDIADPTAATLAQWQSEFKFAIDFQDETAVSDYAACSGETDGNRAGK